MLINTSKITDAAALRRTITKALVDDGWSQPLWLPTTPGDRGESQAHLAVAAGVRVLFVCGGDGTIREALAALAGSSVALAVLPAGTGNVLALNLGLPGDIVGAVRVATRGRRCRIDLGEVDGRAFAVASGIGLDALVLEGTPSRAKHRWGWTAYAASALRHLGDPRFRVVLELDEAQPIAREVHSVLVANFGRFPGGINLLPGAVPDDGLLDVALITPRRLGDWLHLLVNSIGRHPKGGRLESFRVRTVKVTADRSRPREFDGDPLPPSSELNVKVLPGALTVCVPESFRRPSPGVASSAQAGSI